MVREQGTVLIFLFHGLFENAKELQSGVMDPQQGITVDLFSEFVNHFLEQSYRFVSADEILDGLDSNGKYACVTFDDGYFNNLRALPILEEYGVPATFYISTGYVERRESFWWDALYRECRKRGRSEREIIHATAAYKRMKTADIENELRVQFGQRALVPIGDVDRPFTSSELREFATHPCVHLGNHTRDHAILTNYDDAEIQDQIDGAQRDIAEMTGVTSRTIAYPNGNESAKICKVSRDAGLRLGIGVRRGRNHLPICEGSKQAMTLKRFTLWGSRGLETQCRESRSGFSVSRLLRHAQLMLEG